jgi:NCS2 family nucleobase:cation symporter-2
MTDTSIGTPEQLRDPNYTPPLAKAVPLGIQHVLAMFVSNVTPAIIISSVAGIAFGPNADPATKVYLIQMAMMFAGVATLFQTIGLGKVGARLPIVQGTSFAFLPVMIPAMIGAGTAGLAGLMTGVVIGGLFHACLGLFVGRIRFALPPLVTGLIVLMIGLALIKVGIEYAAGGAGDFNRSKDTWGGLTNWFQAGVVLVVTLGLKFFARGMLSVSAVLVGLIVGYIVAFIMGDVNLGGMGDAAWFALPQPFKFGFDLNWAIIIGMCLMAFISAIETVGDVSGITKGGAGREATDAEVTGATYADGLGSALAGVFGSLPNTSFSQNVGLIAMTGVMSRHVVTIGAVFLIACGLVPKVGAIINTIPIQVLGGGVIVMFGMVASAGISMLSDVKWNSRNMVIFAVALSVGLGLQQVPDAFNAFFNVLEDGSKKINTLGILMTSGLLPTAFIAIVLNLVLPAALGEEAEAELAGAVKGHKDNASKG